MPLRCDCDSCEFEFETDDEVAAYAAARDHEATNPSHFVFIEETH